MGVTSSCKLCQSLTIESPQHGLMDCPRVAPAWTAFLRVWDRWELGRPQQHHSFLPHVHLPHILCGMVEVGGGAELPPSSKLCGWLLLP